MIEGVFTFTENTTCVELEIVSIDSDGDGLFLNGSEERITITCGYVFFTTDVIFTGSLFTFSINSFVGIFRFCGDTFFSNKVEGVVHETTIATLVSVVRAIN